MLYNMMGNWGSDCGFGMGTFSFGFMWIFSILFWASVIIAVIVAVKWLLGGKPYPWFGGGRAVDILKERYAKGEINKQQYEEMKKEIGG